MISVVEAVRNADKSWVVARRNGTRYYLGKICEDHPGWKGARYTVNRACIKCSHERRMQRTYDNEPTLKLTRADSIQMDRELESSLKEVWE